MLVKSGVDCLAGPDDVEMSNVEVLAVIAEISPRFTWVVTQLVEVDERPVAGSAFVDGDAAEVGV